MTDRMASREDRCPASSDGDSAAAGSVTVDGSDLDGSAAVDGVDVDGSTSDAETDLDDPESGGQRDDDSVDDVLEAIRERARAVRDRQTERAIARLEASGDLSAEQRDAVERLADRLVAELLAIPESGLRVAAETEDMGTDDTVNEATDEAVDGAIDESALEVARDLFD